MIRRPPSSPLLPYAALFRSWWEGAHGWQGWFLIHPEVKMHPGSTVTALWRSSDTHLDLFATGTDGAVWSTWWEGAHGWQGWFLLQPAGFVHPGVFRTSHARFHHDRLGLPATPTDTALGSTWPLL